MAGIAYAIYFLGHLYVANSTLPCVNNYIDTAGSSRLYEAALVRTDCRSERPGMVSVVVYPVGSMMNLKTHVVVAQVVDHPGDTIIPEKMISFVWKPGGILEIRHKKSVHFDIQKSSAGPISVVFRPVETLGGFD